MEKLTAEQIIEKLNSYEEAYEEASGERFTDSFGYGYVNSDFEPIKELGEMEYKHTQDRALEGDSDVMTTVVLFKNHDVYIRMDGYYASYDGSEWDGEFHEVKPVVKEVTFYEEV